MTTTPIAWPAGATAVGDWSSVFGEEVLGLGLRLWSVAWA
jgi:hypothetical protein